MHDGPGDKLGYHDKPDPDAPGAAEQHADPFADSTASPVGASKAEPVEDPGAPPKVPFYRTRRFIITSIIGNVIGIVFMFVMLFPVVKAIIQDIVNKTAINVTTATITNPTNTSFEFYIQGTVSHTSTVSAVISFPTPLNVSWWDDSTKVPLGYMQLSTLYTSNNHATINDTTTFYITNQTAFRQFASFATTAQNVTWQLEDYDVIVQAEKFPTAHGVSLNKFVTISSIGGFNYYS